MADFVEWQARTFGSSVPLFLTRERLWRRMDECFRTAALLVLEFGVAWGYSTAFLLNNVMGEREDVEWHGFDRFTGLPRAWRRFPAGAFDAEGRPPDLSDPRLHWHVGNVEDTLPSLDLDNYQGWQRLVLFDLDIYEPTAFAWRYIANHLRPGDLLYFDEALDADERRVLTDMVLPAGEYRPLGCTALSLLLEVVELQLERGDGKV